MNRRGFIGAVLGGVSAIVGAASLPKLTALPPVLFDSTTGIAIRPTLAFHPDAFAMAMEPLDIEEAIVQHYGRTRIDHHLKPATVTVFGHGRWDDGRA